MLMGHLYDERGRNMATPMSPSTLVKVLRAAGLKVVEQPGWRTNNRNHKGAWGPANGVMLHHTVTSGTASSVSLCFNGHSALPGPLCHGVIAKDGTVYLVGNGRANHAGLGDDDVLKAVVAEKPLPAANEANTDGNRHFYGFECVNLGDGKDPWPKAQVDAMIKASAAICKHHGWGARSVVGHLEWQPGKIDPRGPGWPGMAAARSRIAAELEPAPKPPAPKPPVTPPKETDDMRLTQLIRDEPLAIPAGESRNVYFNAPDVRDDPNEHGDGGFTFLSSAALYTGNVAVWMPPESRVGVLMTQLLADGTTTSTSSTSTVENTEATVRCMAEPVAGFLPAGRKLFVRLQNYGATAITVSRVELRVLSTAE